MENQSSLKMEPVENKTGVIVERYYLGIAQILIQVRSKIIFKYIFHKKIKRKVRRESIQPLTIIHRVYINPQPEMQKKIRQI